MRDYIANYGTYIISLTYSQYKLSLTSHELSSRINETFYVDDNIEAMTSQLNVMSVLTIESSISEQKLLQAVAKSSKSDPFVQRLYSQKEKTILTAHGKYILLNDVVYYVTKDDQYLLYIPPKAYLPNSDVPLQQQIIHECHDALYAGHFGSAKTLACIQRQFH
jgi:hypothetical protein